MTWSYDDSLTDAKDQIRFLLQDTDEADPLLSDEGIGLYVPGGSLGQATVTLAAAECARAIGAKFSRRAMSMSEGGTSTNWGDRAKRYFDLADQLKATDAETSATGLFDWAEFAVDDFSAREIIRNDLLRDAV